VFILGISPGGNFPRKCRIPRQKENKGKGREEKGKDPLGTPYSPGAKSIICPALML